jgi:CheY-like chemotaxis protein
MIYGVATSPQLMLVRERRSRYGRMRPRPRVLLVEDDALARRAASRLLAQDFEVTAVCSAAEALSLFRAGAFDCVVTDYQMAAMTGIELLEQIRVLEPRVRRVLMSGTEIPGLVGYIGSGVVEHCLIKPVDLRTALLPILISTLTARD